MSFIHRFLVHLLDPELKHREARLAELERRYADESQTLVRLDQWIRVVDQFGRTTAVEYHCRCRNVHMIADMMKAFGEHRCHCGNEFSISPDGLAKLPVRKLGGGQQRTNAGVLDTWAEGSQGEVEYERADPAKF